MGSRCSISSGQIRVVKFPIGDFVSVDSSRLEECMALFQREGMAGLHISSMGLYKAPDLEFLKDYPHVRAVAASEAHSLDLSGLRYLRT